MKKVLKQFKKDFSNSCCKPAAQDEDFYAYKPFDEGKEVARRPGGQDVIEYSERIDHTLLRGPEVQTNLIATQKDQEHAEITLGGDNITHDREETFLPLLSSTKHAHISPREIQRTTSADPAICDTSRSFWECARRKGDRSAIVRRRTVQVTPEEISQAMSSVTGFSTSEDETFNNKKVTKEEKEWVDNLDEMDARQEQDPNETRAPPNTPCLLAENEHHQQFADPLCITYIVREEDSDEEVEEETLSSNSDEEHKTESAQKNKRRRSSGPKGHSTPMVGSFVHIKDDTINESSIHFTPGNRNANISADAAIFDLSMQIQHAAKITQQGSMACNILTHLTPLPSTVRQEVVNHKPFTNGKEIMDNKENGPPIPDCQPPSELIGNYSKKMFVLQNMDNTPVKRHDYAEEVCQKEMENEFAILNKNEQFRNHLEDFKEEESVLVDIRNIGVNVVVKSSDLNESPNCSPDFSFSIARAAALVRTGNLIVGPNQPLLENHSLSLVDLDGDTERKGSNIMNESSLLMPGKSIWKTPDQVNLELQPVPRPRKLRLEVEETPPVEEYERKLVDEMESPICRPRKFGIRPFSHIVCADVVSSDFSIDQLTDHATITSSSDSVRDFKTTKEETPTENIEQCCSSNYHSQDSLNAITSEKKSSLLLDSNGLPIPTVDIKKLSFQNETSGEDKFLLRSVQMIDKTTFDFAFQTSETHKEELLPASPECAVPTFIRPLTIDSASYANSLSTNSSSVIPVSKDVNDRTHLVQSQKRGLSLQLSREDSLLYNETIGVTKRSSTCLSINSTQSTFYGEGADYCIPENIFVKKAKILTDEDDLYEDPTQFSDTSSVSDHETVAEHGHNRDEGETQSYERKISPWQQKKFFSPIEEVSEENASFSCVAGKSSVADRLPLSDAPMLRMNAYSSDSADSEVWRCFNGPPSSNGIPEYSPFHDESSVFYPSNRPETAIDADGLFSRPGSPLPPYSRSGNHSVGSASESEMASSEHHVDMFSDIPPPFPNSAQSVLIDTASSATNSGHSLIKGEAGDSVTSISSNHQEAILKDEQHDVILRPITPISERSFTFISFDQSRSATKPFSSRARKPTVASPSSFISLSFGSKAVKYCK